MHRSRILLSAGALVLAGCVAPSPPPVPAPGAGPVGFVEQGWSPEVRAWMYSFSQGSQIMPWSWFAALEHESQDGRPFGADAFARFGYLPRATPTEARGLPVGFTVGRGSRDIPGNDREWLGMNCTACHTNRVTVAGRTVQIDGAPAMADFQHMLWSFTTALRRTAEDPARRARFTQAVAAAEPRFGNAEAVGRQLDAEVAKWRELAGDSITPVLWGPGRNDAFGMIFNRALGYNLGRRDNIRPPDAPVSYPFLWTTHRQTWIQWHGGVDNRNFLGRLSRNVGQVLGVFGHAPTLASRDELRTQGLRSSVEITALLSAEAAIGQLRPPAWPSWAPQPDPAQVAAGERLYDRHCVSCHVRVPGVRGPTSLARNDIVVYCTPADTDLRTIRNIVGLREPPVAPPRTVATGALEGWTRVNRVFRDPVPGPTGTGGQTLRTVVLGTILDGRMHQVGAGDVIAPEPPDAVRFYDAREGVVLLRDLLGGTNRAVPAYPSATGPAVPDNLPPRACDGDRDPPGGPPRPIADRLHYKAGPLHGIWATGPFLHNGSVRTIDELLGPASARAVRFRVGGTELDLDRLGFRESTGDQTAIFDTRQPGAGNHGHEYPAGGLSPADRAALIAYLKLL